MDEVLKTRALVKEVLAYINSSPWKGYYSSQVENMLERVDQPCELAIVGEVKAGKSSFVNALLDSDLAMVGETEMTATINFFKYGHPEDKNKPVRVVWEDGSEEWQTREFLDSLQVNTPEVLEKASKIDHLEYFLDNEKLRRVTLVDTPGTGSLVETHENRTNDYFEAGKQNLRQKHNEQSMHLKNRADAVVVITGRVEHEATNQLVSKFSQNTSAFNSLGVMTKIDLESGTSTDDWNRRCDKYHEMLRHQLNCIVPVSASVYSTVMKLTREHKMEEIKDALQYIPLDEFEEVCKYSQTFLDEALEDYFNDYKLPYQTRKKIAGYADDWMVFYTIARELRTHTVEEAIQNLLEYSGIPQVNKVLEKQFFSRSRIIRCNHIANELHDILFTIRNRYLPDIRIDVTYKDIYLNIIKESEFHNKNILDAFKKFVETNICTPQQLDICEEQINQLIPKVEALQLLFRETDNKTEALMLLEKHSKSFSEEEYDELEKLFGIHAQSSLTSDRRIIARRQSYWRSRKNSSSNVEINKIYELAVYAYGTILTT